MTSSLAEELDLSLCFDTGHVLTGLAGNHDLFDALDRCLPRLAEVHLHDAPRHNPGEKIAYGQDHQRLGTRNLDVGRLLDRLDQAGFMGPVVLELTVPEALASRDYIRSIRPGFLV
jgi:sugar phosphate isomerase/epimerase